MTIKVIQSEAGTENPVIYHLLKGLYLTSPRPHIVDIQGLADVLSFNKRTIQRTWKEYPHIFPGTGSDARSARFILSDVLGFLANRDYTEAQKNAISRQKEKTVGRTSQKSVKRQKPATFRKPASVETKNRGRVGVPQAEKVVQNKNGSQHLGKGTLEKDKNNPGVSTRGGSRHNIFGRL